MSWNEDTVTIKEIKAYVTRILFNNIKWIYNSGNNTWLWSNKQEQVSLYLLCEIYFGI